MGRYRLYPTDEQTAGLVEHCAHARFCWNLALKDAVSRRKASDDRAWCVATEIDFAWTYVGGSAAAIRAVLADPRLEALRAKLTDRFTRDSDVLNAAPDPE